MEHLSCAFQACDWTVRFSIAAFNRTFINKKLSDTQSIKYAQCQTADSKLYDLAASQTSTRLSVVVSSWAVQTQCLPEPLIKFQQLCDKHAVFPSFFTIKASCGFMSRNLLISSSSGRKSLVCISIRSSLTLLTAQWACWKQLVNTSGTVTIH